MLQPSNIIFVQSNEELTKWEEHTLQSPQNHKAKSNIVVEQIYAPNASKKSSKKNLKKKSSAKIKEPTPPVSSVSIDEQPAALVIPPAPEIAPAISGPVVTAVPPAPPSPPKYASLSKNMYPMPNALPSRPVCSDEGRVPRSHSRHDHPGLTNLAVHFCFCQNES